jgi:hypothetical protein
VPAIFFLSDYGTADEFVGVVHAVLHRSAARVQVIDLTHHVPAFDVAAGGATLARSVPHLGAGVVLAVVDPGVGTGRRGVAVAVPASGGPGWLVGPDNGLLTPAVDLLGGPTAVIALAPRERDGGAGVGRPGTFLAGSTFDGRDLFAPAAAHLVVGGDPAALGTLVDPSTLVPAPSRVVAPSAIDAEGWLVTSVLAVDTFGNTQLQADPGLVDRLRTPVGETVLMELEPGMGRSSGGPVRVRRVAAFADLEPGEPGVLVDGNGHLALVLNRASAAKRFGLDRPGRQVRFRADT